MVQTIPDISSLPLTLTNMLTENVQTESTMTGRLKNKFTDLQTDFTMWL